MAAARLLPGFCAALRAALLRNPAPAPIPATPHRNPSANRAPRTTRARAPSARRRARTAKTAKPKPRRASRAWTAVTRAWRVLVVPMARPRSARAPPRPKTSACIIEIR